MLTTPSAAALVILRLDVGTIGIFPVVSEVTLTGAWLCPHRRVWGRQLAMHARGENHVLHASTDGALNDLV